MNKKTNKTAQVLKLLTKSNSGSIENPIINQEFKEEVIHTREVRHTKKVSSKADEISALQSGDGGDAGINIVAELVQEWLPETIKRFNFEPSDIFKAEMTVEALNIIPPKYVYVHNENDFASIKGIKEKYKAQVINTLVRLAVKAKNNHKYVKSS